MQVHCLYLYCMHSHGGFLRFNRGDYYLEACVFRLAVPFFFVASGFFFGRKLSQENGSKSVLQGYIKRLGIPLFFWELVNIAIEILKQLVIKKYHPIIIACNIAQSIVFYPYGALWYVQALFLSLIVISYAYQKGWIGRCVIVSAVLYLLGLLGNSYYFLVVGTKIQWVVDQYLSIFVSTRNALFVALFFVSTGVWIATYRTQIEKIRRKKYYVIILYCLLLLEAFLIRNCRSADDKSMFISFLVLIPSMFVAIASNDSRINNAKALRSYSTGIYFMHKAVIHVWLLIFTLLNIQVGATVEFIIVLMSCLIACKVAYRIDNKYINMLIK